MAATGGGPVPVHGDPGRRRLAGHRPRRHRLRHRDRVRRPHDRLLRPRRRRQRRRRRQQQRPAEPRARDGRRPDRPRAAPARLLQRPGPSRPGADRGRASPTRSRGSTRLAGGISVRPVGSAERFEALPTAGVRHDAHRPLGLRGLPARRVRVPRHRLRPRRQLGLDAESRQRRGDAAAQPAQGGDDAARRLRSAARRRAPFPTGGASSTADACSRDGGRRWPGCRCG